MLSLGGLLGSSFTTPFRLDGFVQYFSNIPSWIHFERDRESESARTPLHVQEACQKTGGRSRTQAQYQRPGTAQNALVASSRKQRTFLERTGRPCEEDHLAGVSRPSAAAGPAGSTWAAVALLLRALAERMAKEQASAISLKEWPWQQC